MVVERAESSGSGSSLARELHKLYSGWLWANELILPTLVNVLCKVGMNMSCLED